jgi:hypothetical protein
MIEVRRQEMTFICAYYNIYIYIYIQVGAYSNIHLFVFKLQYVRRRKHSTDCPRVMD